MIEIAHAIKIVFMKIIFYEVSLKCSAPGDNFSFYIFLIRKREKNCTALREHYKAWLRSTLKIPEQKTNKENCLSIFFIKNQIQ